jgi:hypothetical protein
MADCYHPGIVFNDPAFGTLYGEEAKKMWQVLIQRGGGSIKITYEDIRANESEGSAKWSATYTFSGTGRTVLNKVNASFKFKDGTIIMHTDRFNLWRWAGQALGWKGYLFGWSSFMKRKIQMSARRLLVEGPR